MSLLLEQLAWLAEQRSDGVALRDQDTQLNWRQVADQVQQLQTQLQKYAGAAIALVGDNCLQWVMCDLALMGLPVRVVPIPTFFTSEQIDHVFEQADVDLVIGDASALQSYCDAPDIIHECDIGVSELAAPRVVVNQYEKVTFTSGSTGTPKGVRLSLEVLEHTAVAIADAMADVQVSSHLGVLPYATLLENVAGIYAPILQQVTVHVRALAQMGFNGANQFNVFAFMQQVQMVQPDACILVPQLLMALVLACEKGFPVPSHFKFIAVGGGKVSTDLLQRAVALNIPVFEGYGLSECGSVVCLNQPGANRPGSVGKPLSQVRAEFSDEGELLVYGNTMLGYLGEANSDGPIATGDLGWMDEDGFVHISGRKKNMFITAYGRNVNPEWVEAELTAHPAISQAAVFGEAMAENVAIITPRMGFDWQAVEAAVAEANQRLPEYARVSRLTQSHEPFSVSNGMATANGRNCRNAIEQHYFNLQGATSMSFFEQLTAQTAAAREYLLSAPVIQAVPQGRFRLAGYQYFLEQAYHHVKHTVPLMMACGGRLPEDKEWVREALAEYIEDEYGHQEWILNDIEACGGDKDTVRKAQPSTAIELMVAFLYDQIQRQNPMAFFGMVMVLEGTSIKLATQMGKIVQQKLDLPNQAFSYLYSHGELDVDHFDFFCNLMDKVTDPKDQQAIVHSANMVYRLYGDMLRCIPLEQVQEEKSQQESSHEAA
ncbi:MAG: AMP-dependent synthetase [Pseudomonadales bacterium]|nr:AMP-dependent synthetase [Pseudomonadales bacterium]